LVPLALNMMFFHFYTNFNDITNDKD
jgi:hypothetical protein